MDARSENTLATVSPALAEKVRAAANSLDDITLCVYFGLRTAVQQDALYAQGRTVPGNVVTNAPAGHSMHNYGLAVDVVPYLPGSSQLNWNVKSEDFQAMVKALKDQGLEYGGDWVHFKDNDHFQMPGYPPSPSAEMVALYGKEPIETFWNAGGSSVGSFA